VCSILWQRGCKNGFLHLHERQNSVYFVSVQRACYVFTSSAPLSQWPSWCLYRANVGSPCEASHAGESIPVQNWNSLQGGQVHYADAAAGASNDRGRSSALQLFMLFMSFNWNEVCDCTWCRWQTLRRDIAWSCAVTCCCCCLTPTEQPSISYSRSFVTCRRCRSIIRSADSWFYPGFHIRGCKQEPGGRTHDSFTYLLNHSLSYLLTYLNGAVYI